MTGGEGLSKITQIEFDNAKLSVLVETYEQENSKEVGK